MKYSGELVKAANAASWKGAGAESVSFICIFLIADEIQAGAIAHPILQPNKQFTANTLEVMTAITFTLARKCKW